MMERPREPAHRQFEDMAVSHVLGGLNTNEGRLFRSHLVECHSCRARVGELRAIAHDLADVERDERRTTERRQVDTKPVELEVDEAEDDEPDRPRRGLAYAAAAVVLLVGLVSWNFILRESNTRLEMQLAGLEDATGAVAFGLPWDVTYPGEDDSVRAAVALRSDQLTLLVDGVDNATHRIFLYDAEGDELLRRAIDVEDSGRLVVFDDVAPGATRLVLRRSDAATQDPSGEIVLEATRP